MVANLLYRRALNEWANQATENQQVLMDACRNDVLFWMNTFVWLYEPRTRYDNAGRRLPEIFPMIVWDHQVPVVEALDNDFGRRDICVSKSRGEGMSWLSILMFMHRWCFVPNSKFGMASYNEDMMDNRENPDSLFWKVDFTVKHLPLWMSGAPEIDWKRNIGRHTLINNRNGSIITGYASTAELASGSRSQVFLVDELAKWKRPNDRSAIISIQQTTFSRLVVSTPLGPEGAYYEMMHEPGANLTKLHLNWKQNPTRNQFLYKVVSGKPVAMTPDGLSPETTANWEALRKTLTERGFSIEGTVRSPWYDAECLRPLATPRSIAQELDEDFGGSISRFFTMEAIDRQLQKHARKPNKVGRLKLDRIYHAPVWIDDPIGELRLWFEMPVHGSPPPDHYVIGVDLSAGAGGTHTSNSSASVVRRNGGRKVAELVSSTTKPEDFCDLVITLANWFSYYGEPAFVIWDDGGPAGAQFRQRMMATQFRNFYKQAELAVIKSKKRVGKPGFHFSPQAKAMVLGALDQAYQHEFFINPSKEALEEAKQYIRQAGGRIVHVGSTVADDPSAAGDAHGDRVIADALANFARTTLGQVASTMADTAAAKAATFPPGSFAWRQQMARAKREREEAGQV